MNEKVEEKEVSGCLKMDELFGDDWTCPLNPGETHLACALLIDVSEDMGEENIKIINEGIKRFKEQVMLDALNKRRVDISLITFGSDVEVISDFVPIPKMPTPELKTSGSANMAQGIQTAIDLVKKRTECYHILGTPCYKPSIFMLTKGNTDSSQEEMKAAEDRIHQEETRGTHGHLSFWPCLVGEYDKPWLFSLTKRKRVLEIRNQGFFDWLGGEYTDLYGRQHKEYDTLQIQLAENIRLVCSDWY